MIKSTGTLEKRIIVMKIRTGSVDWDVKGVEETLTYGDFYQTFFCRRDISRIYKTKFFDYQTRDSEPLLTKLL